jgi:hypothetical protein
MGEQEDRRTEGLKIARLFSASRELVRKSWTDMAFVIREHRQPLPGDGREGIMLAKKTVPFILTGVIVVLAFAFTAGSGCTQTEAENGTLTGNVSIGPLYPVEPCVVSHDRIVAAYAARPIRISIPAGSLVTTITGDPDTGYAVSLKPGIYVVDIPHQGIGGSRELPKTVTIVSGETVRLNISIDTGIR